MGPMIATIAAFEDSLTALERIFTTPLPFVYSMHVSTFLSYPLVYRGQRRDPFSNVWIYLFFLPF